ncbi:cyclin-L1 [Ctenocephalides felis]|uniref:cyclin-L1 n=1 Tax=Ctenocephalides felis TaxID=7515 RepID=UPI000E6E3255|nr:cyclin-L1 [Ctenocephalides felis]
MTNKTEAPISKVSKPYGEIVLTLENCLLPEEKLLQTPSKADGLDEEIEKDLRILGCELIQSAGILLKLPQVAMATGQVLFQRFYYSKSFVRHSMETTAMACICLASKIEEAPRRIRDVINVFHHLKQLKDEKPIETLILDQQYIDLKNQVIKSERRVLKELGFCVHVKHPHKLIVMFLQVLCYEKNEKLMQLSWNYMNDSLRTDVFMRHNPETVACACIYMTARELNINLPKSPDWFSIFNVSKADIHDVCYSVLNLYSRPKPDADSLEKAVSVLRKHYQDERAKARNASSNNNSPKADSPHSPQKEKTTGGSHNAWGGFISRSGSHVIHEKSKVKSDSPHSPGKNSKKLRSRSRSRSKTPLSPRNRSPTERHKSKKAHKRRSRSVSPYSPGKSTIKKIRNKSRYRSRSKSPEWKSSVDGKSDRKSNSKRTERHREAIDDEPSEKNVKIERYERYSDRERERDRDKHARYSDKGSDDSRSRSKYQRSEDRSRDRSRDRRR